MNLSKGLLAGVSMDELKRRMVTPPYQDYWQHLTRRWREVADWEEQTGRIVNIGSCAGGQVTWLVREAALEHVLTGDRKALDYVGKQIDKLADIVLHHPENWKQREHPYWSESHVCLAADMCRASLDARRLDDLKRMVREKFLEAPFIGWNAHDRYLSGHNMTVTEQVCAGICALTWGEDAGRADWAEVVDRAIESARLYCRYSLDRAGYGFEGTMYAYVPLDTIYLFAQMLLQNGRENLFETIPELKTYPEAIRSLLFPDRIGLTPLADGGILNPKSYAWLLLTARHYHRPEDLGLWYEYRGPGRGADPWPNNNPRCFWPDTGATGPVRRDGWGHNLLPFLWWDAAAPMIPVADSKQPLSRYSPGTELALFRTSWSRDAVYVNFSGQGRGHVALDHAHNDGGHFTIFAHGEYLAIDTGYWNKYEDHHSVPLIEGQGSFNRTGDEPRRWHYAGRLTGFQQHALLDHVMADLAHPRNCVWADRHLLFIRYGDDDAYIVLVDDFNPDHAVHSYQWQLQAHPDSAIRISGPRTAVIEKPKARLEITFLSPLATDFPACPHSLEVRTDFVYGANVKQAGDEVPEDHPVWKSLGAYTRDQAREIKSDLSYTTWYRPRLVAEQKGPNFQLMTVIVPRRTGVPSLAVRDRTAKRVLRADVKGEGFTDTIISARDHGRVTFDDVRGYADLAVIRRDAGGRVVSQWTLGGETLDCR
ncbi:MAG: hypothetical protein A2340_09175 [Lentisphaerae bacterium RIFOXYB12_FULL_60_10]|nr:MAG: hypothetical protein A2340_09175 [Lentisphaerae bacterium RIFOXYB12_FULL_60_10]